MRRLVLAVVTALGTSGCWIDACVIERAPPAPDLCRDIATSIWDDPPPEGTSDLDACEGEWHELTTCSQMGFTAPCGRFLIRPNETCR